MKKHHIVIIVGILIVIAIWYTSKQTTSLGSSVVQPSNIAPDNATSTRTLYGE